MQFAILTEIIAAKLPPFYEVQDIFPIIRLFVWPIFILCHISLLQSHIKSSMLQPPQQGRVIDSAVVGFCPELFLRTWKQEVNLETGSQPGTFPPPLGFVLSLYPPISFSLPCVPRHRTLLPWKHRQKTERDVAVAFALPGRRGRRKPVWNPSLAAEKCPEPPSAGGWKEMQFGKTNECYTSVKPCFRLWTIVDDFGATLNNSEQLMGIIHYIYNVWICIYTKHFHWNREAQNHTVSKTLLRLNCFENKTCRIRENTKTPPSFPCNLSVHEV